MVGMWTPEPPREPCNENLSTVGTGVVIVEHDSSDSEDEIAAYSGYELLPQLPPDPPDSGSEDIDDAMSGGDLSGSDTIMTSTADTEDTGVSHIGSNQCNFDDEMQAELREVWSGSSNGNSIEMGSEQAEQVRAAMANFALPASAIPAWAIALPEEQWKQQLLDRIQRLQQQHSDEQSKT